MIIDKIRKKEKLSTTIIKPHLNTGTILDMFTGTFLPSKINKNNNFTLNGGFFIINSIIGKPQTYKTTMSLSYLSRILHIYDEVECIIYDTESSINDYNRIIDLKGDLPINKDISNKILLKDKFDYNMDTFFEFILEDILKDKRDHIKDYIVTTPFINPITKKNLNAIIPTIVVIDSWTAMQSKLELDMVSKSNLSNEKLNRLFLVDGNKKAILLRQLGEISSKYGIYFILTAHVGKSAQMSMYDSTPSHNVPYMKFSEKIKGTSEQFLFYSLMMLDARKVFSLLDNNKECYYPFGNNSILNELNKINTIVVKSKSGTSGSVMPNIISQYSGLLSSLTNFELAKLYLEPKKSKTYNSCDLLPDVKFTRKQLRPKVKENYELYRGLEIVAQLVVAKYYWSYSKFPGLEYLFANSIEKISEMILKNNTVKINDILNSRGYWLFDENKKKDERPYMSLIDILNVLKK